MFSKLFGSKYTINDLTDAVKNKDMALVEKIIFWNKQLIHEKDKVYYISLKIISYNNFYIMYRVA